MTKPTTIKKKKKRGYSENVTSCKPGQRPSQELDQVGTLISDFHLPELWKIDDSYLPLSVGYLGIAAWTKTSSEYNLK